jgi:hypothetical protein
MRVVDHEGREGHEEERRKRVEGEGGIETTSKKAFNTINVKRIDSRLNCCARRPRRAESGNMVLCHYVFMKLRKHIIES